MKGKTYDSCEDVVKYLCTLFNEDTNSERCRAVQEHLKQCPDCAAYCDSLEQMIGLYRAASPELPDQTRHAILKALGIPDTG